jgi:hypothetical protein
MSSLTLDEIQQCFPVGDYIDYETQGKGFFSGIILGTILKGNPDTRIKIPITIAMTPPILIVIIAKSLGSALLNCHPVLIYQANFGKMIFAIPAIMKSIGII